MKTFLSNILFLARYLAFVVWLLILALFVFMYTLLLILFVIDLLSYD